MSTTTVDRLDDGDIILFGDTEMLLVGEPEHENGRVFWWTIAEGNIQGYIALDPTVPVRIPDLTEA